VRNYFAQKKEVNTPVTVELICPACVLPTNKRLHGVLILNRIAALAVISKLALTLHTDRPHT